MTAEELKKIEDFIKNATQEDKDDIEQIMFMNKNPDFEGWITLSSGNERYISPPRKSAKEIGSAMKAMFDRINSSSL